MRKRKSTDADTVMKRIVKECKGISVVMNLEELRKEIDKVDSQLIELYEKRIEIAENIARAKMETGKAIFDQEREKIKLNAVREKTSKTYNKDAVEELFVFLMTKSKERQELIIREEDK